MGYEVKKRDTVKLYNLPKDVKYCKKCVISNQRPRIVFDEEGVCSPCRYWEKKFAGGIDWAAREKEFKDLLDRHRKSNGEYDCLVPSSGGKDSAMVAHRLKYEYGMNPLTITWAPHAYTEIGRDNFYGLIDAGLDNIMATPDSKLHRKLTKISFCEIGEPFQPFVYGQVNFPMQFAVKYNIPLVFYGENGDAEYGGDPEAENVAFYRPDDKIVRDYFSQIPPEAFAEFGIKETELKKYGPPELEDLNKVGVECHFWSYYFNWLPQSNYYYAAEHCNFKPNPKGRSESTYSKYASLDDKVDGYHYYLALMKFGLGRCTSDAAHEIRENLITRDEGVALVRKFDTEFPGDHFKFFLEYCDITEQFFWDVMDSWRSDHIWRKENGEWKLNHQVE